MIYFSGFCCLDTYLQWTEIGPSWPNCSFVLCTWPIKSMKPSPDFGTPCSGQSVNWNCLTVRDCPSWEQNMGREKECTEPAFLNGTSLGNMEKWQWKTDEVKPGSQSELFHRQPTHGSSFLVHHNDPHLCGFFSGRQHSWNNLGTLVPSFVIKGATLPYCVIRYMY